MVQLRRWHAGAGALLLVGGAVAWWTVGGDEAAPDPVRVSCSGPGLAGAEEREADGPFIRSAPRALRTEPVPDPAAEPTEALDHVPPGGTEDAGYRLDEETATVHHADGSGTRSRWRTRVGDEPPAPGASVTDFPGGGELIMVQGRQRGSGELLTAALDRDGRVLLSCLVAEGPSGPVDELPTPSPDGSTLLVPTAGERDERWVEAHAVDGGGHLWSARGSSHAVDDERAYVVGDGGITANDLCMQIQADVLGVDVVKPVVAETTALGAAYSAGLANGFWANTDDLRANWHEDKRWTPQWSEEQRERGYAGWRKAVERTLNWVDVD